MIRFRASFRAAALTTAAVACVSLAVAAPASASVSASTSASPGANGHVRHLSASDLDKLARADAHPSSHAANVAAARENERDHGLPTFSGSFTTGGVTYSYTMLGAPPASGRTTLLKHVYVPLRVAFTGFDTDVTFEPDRALRNILGSPIYLPAQYKDGFGQFTDMFQRAEFWNQMNRYKTWHTLVAPVRITRPYTITVGPDAGQLQDYHGANIGNVNIDYFDAQLHAIVPSLHLRADETPVFVTDSVTADALGYHDAFTVPDGHGGTRMQTIIYTSWLDPAVVGTLLGDVSTLNHEVAEWMDDPFVDNAAPNWAFPPFDKVCSDIPYVEVGDPQGNGPDYQLFPTYPVTLHGYTYHLQDLALLQWFTQERPSSAFHGWYDFPDTTQLTSPSVTCS